MGLMGESMSPVIRTPQQETLLAHLRAIYDPADLLVEMAQLVPYESDALTAFHTVPLAAVFPHSTEQIVATVKACYALDIPFLARGSGTSLSGGSRPIEGGL